MANGGCYGPTMPRSRPATPAPTAARPSGKPLKISILWVLIAATIACSGGRDRGGEATPAAGEPAALAPPSDGGEALHTSPVEPLWSEGGLTVERQAWQLGADAGVAWRARVPLPGDAKMAYLGGVEDFPAFLPIDAGPWAAINGGFYDAMRDAMGLVVTAGEERVALTTSGGSGVFSFGPQGPRVVHRDAWQPGDPEALQSIDRLVDAGTSLVKRRSSNRAARSAVVVGREALWLVALAADASITPTDGGVRLRDTVGEGLPLWAFADYLLQSTDVVAALNLDGAISTSFAAAAGEHRFTVEGERGTINAVVIRPAAP